jgi:diketogulonate reductase-like aldo/keto reductase
VEETKFMVEPVQEVPMITLNNGIRIPQLGLGVWKAQDGDEVEAAVSHALKTGYRLIDTAAAYGNEKGVGQAIADSDIDRQEIFVTTKLWNDSHDYDAALRAFDASMSKLGLEYLDMYLIHWPVPAQDTFTEAWRALERLYDEKRIRAIGVCNFHPEHFEKLLSTANVVPAVDQIELHPRLQQHGVRDYCAEHDIRVESWSPIMRGGELLQDPELTKIAKKYGKTVAQVILRWHLESGFIVIPKSVHAERIDENYDVSDFELDELEMRSIASLDSGERTGPDPATVNFS